MARRRKLSERDARHDPAYRRAKREQFAARAVYKLEELDKRWKLLAKDRRVLDLGCWPGSWLQYEAEAVGAGGEVIGVDLKDVDIPLPAWVQTHVVDVETLDPAELVQRFGHLDVVLSDMGPNTTGDRRTDQLRSEALFESALFVARGVLRRGGHFAAKVFQGGAFPGLLAEVRSAFQEGHAFRPKNTRPGSIEQYIVGRGLR